MRSTSAMTPRQAKRGRDFERRSKKDRQKLQIQQLNDQWIRKRLTKC